MSTIATLQPLPGNPSDYTPAEHAALRKEGYYIKPNFFNFVDAGIGVVTGRVARGLGLKQMVTDFIQNPMSVISMQDDDEEDYGSDDSSESTRSGRGSGSTRSGTGSGQANLRKLDGDDSSAGSTHGGASEATKGGSNPSRTRAAAKKTKPADKLLFPKLTPWDLLTGAIGGIWKSTIEPRFNGGNGINSAQAKLAELKEKQEAAALKKQEQAERAEEARQKALVKAEAEEARRIEAEAAKEESKMKSEARRDNMLMTAFGALLAFIALIIGVSSFA